MNYTWKVVNTTIKDSADLSKIVVSCSWYKEGQDENGKTGRCYSNTQFDSSQIDPAAFVPFDELTEELVLSWIQVSITDHQNTQLDLCIQQDMQRNMYPETTVMPPWEVIPPAVEPETPATAEESTEQTTQGE